MTDTIDVTRDPAKTTPGRRLNNWSAVTDPGATNDEDDGPGQPGSHSGYERGSRWLNTVTYVMWSCVDSSVGAAIWTSGGSGGGSGSAPRIVVMRPGITNPPEPVVNVDGDGWVYAEVD